jgi:putative redox protein
MDDPAALIPPGPEKVLVQETGAGLYQVRADAAGSTFLIDEPVALGGLGSGPNPYDLLSAALAACTAMTVRLYVDRKRWPVDHIAVRVGHQRRTYAARDRFDRELMIEGVLNDTQRARLLEIANGCPVHMTLSRGADVHTALGGPVVNQGSGPPHGLHGAHMIESCADEFESVTSTSIAV